MISVIIPLYNKEASIKDTLETVIQQSYQDFEIVIVNDGSTDKSLEEAQKVCDPRIRIFSQQNAGVSAARNRGIEEAQGEYVAFLDADDEWNKDYLETKIELIKKYPTCDIFSNAYNVHFDGENHSNSITLTRMEYIKEDGILNNYFEICTYSAPPIWTSAVVIRKLIIQNEKFPVGVTLGEDLIVWARLACKCQIAFSKKVVATYEKRSSGAAKVPRRIPDVDDFVGKALKDLAMANPTISFLRHYAAKWHQMRMSTYARLGITKGAWFEMRQIKQYRKISIKEVVYLMLSFLPKTFIRYILTYIAK